MKAMEKIRKFWKDESGLETVEYAVITALITIGLIAAIGALSGAIQGAFNRLATVIQP